jgi:hypothetical protein
MGLNIPKEEMSSEAATIKAGRKFALTRSF